MIPHHLRTVVITFLVLLLGACSANARCVLSRSIKRASASNPMAQDSRSQQGVNKIESGSIADTVASLHQISADDYKVPLEARPLLERLKHQIRDLISQILTTTSTEQRNSVALRTRIWDELTSRGVTIGQPREHPTSDDDWESKYRYGDLFDVKVNHSVRHPDLIAVTTTLEIPCGQDSSLYVFRKSSRDWRLILAQEANDYDLISGAQGLFDYRISPGRSREFFVLTVNVNPWCTSNWQSLRYSALRPGLSAYEPHALTRGEETIYLGVEPPPYKLVVKRKSFSIRFSGESSRAEIMNGITSRDHILKYLIRGTRAVRISR